jgi:glyoxylase I family protein
VLDHVAVAVTDLERSRRFCRDVLGLTEVERPAYPVPGAWFEVAGGGMVHLSVVEHPVGSPGGPIDSRESHFAIRVADFAATLEALRALGYDEHADGPLHIQVNPYTIAKVAQIYLRDPDGNLVELNAPLET